ncbi:hypothetical protein PDL71_17545 [Lacibacter sp. MH-610]
MNPLFFNYVLESGTTPIINSLFGLLIAAVGIPVYILSKPGK